MVKQQQLSYLHPKFERDLQEEKNTKRLHRIQPISEKDSTIITFIHSLNYITELMHMQRLKVGGKWNYCLDEVQQDRELH